MLLLETLLFFTDLNFVFKNKTLSVTLLVRLTKRKIIFIIEVSIFYLLKCPSLFTSLKRKAFGIFPFSSHVMFLISMSEDWVVVYNGRTLLTLLVSIVY